MDKITGISGWGISVLLRIFFIPRNSNFGSVICNLYSGAHFVRQCRGPIHLNMSVYILYTSGLATACKECTLTELNGLHAYNHGKPKWHSFKSCFSWKRNFGPRHCLTKFIHWLSHHVMRRMPLCFYWATLYIFHVRVSVNAITVSFAPQWVTH